MTHIVGHFINGKIINDTAHTQDVYNPSTGEVSKQVALAGKATVEEAVAPRRPRFPSGAKHR